MEKLTESLITRSARATTDMKRCIDVGITSIRDVGGLGLKLRDALLIIPFRVQIFMLRVKP